MEFLQELMNHHQRDTSDEIQHILAKNSDSTALSLGDMTEPVCSNPEDQREQTVCDTIRELNKLIYEIGSSKDLKSSIENQSILSQATSLRDQLKAELSKKPLPDTQQSTPSPGINLQPDTF